MTAPKQNTPRITWVAIDIAKQWNQVVVEDPEGRRHRFRAANSSADHDRLVAFLKQQPSPCQVALEPTGNYHRPLAYKLLQQGIAVCLVSSVAAARYREVTYNSWDKNDPKDTEVILDLLKQGKTQTYHDPLLAGIQDRQELSQTYGQIAQTRTRLKHSLQTHYLPLYWPEFERYWHASRSDWVVQFLLEFPTPASVRQLDKASFIQKAWSLVGRKANKRAWLEELYHFAKRTIALPVPLDSLALRMFRLQLAHYQQLTQMRKDLEQLAEQTMGTDSDFALLQTIPGIGPVIALIIMAEAGDLRRFAHHRQFLKFCGLDLAKLQSGSTRGRERLSKRGNARLRSAFWLAAVVAVRQRENSLRAKFERYIKVAPTDRDRRRKALTAVAAKIARIAHAIVKTGEQYRPYHEAAIPSGSIPLTRPWRPSGPRR
jgi:transposase